MMHLHPEMVGKDPFENNKCLLMESNPHGRRKLRHVSGQPVWTTQRSDVLGPTGYLFRAYFPASGIGGKCAAWVVPLQAHDAST